MRYAFTKDRFVVSCARSLKNGTTLCRVITWSVEESKFVGAEAEPCYTDELEFLTPSQAEEALEVERRHWESEADAKVDSVMEEFFRDMGL